MILKKKVVIFPNTSFARALYPSKYILLFYICIFFPMNKILSLYILGIAYQANEKDARVLTEIGNNLLLSKSDFF